MNPISYGVKTIKLKRPTIDVGLKSLTNYASPAFVGRDNLADVA